MFMLHSDWFHREPGLPRKPEFHYGNSERLLMLDAEEAEMSREAFDKEQLGEQNALWAFNVLNWDDWMEWHHNKTAENHDIAWLEPETHDREMEWIKPYTPLWPFLKQVFGSNHRGPLIPGKDPFGTMVLPRIWDLEAFFEMPALVGGDSGISEIGFMPRKFWGDKKTRAWEAARMARCLPPE